MTTNSLNTPFPEDKEGRFADFTMESCVMKPITNSSRKSAVQTATNEEGCKHKTDDRDESVQVVALPGSGVPKPYPS